MSRNVKMLLALALAALSWATSSLAVTKYVLVEKTMEDSCNPDTNTVVNPTAQALTAIGTSIGNCTGNWGSGANFTNAYRSVRLGKQNRTCDSEVNLQAKESLQPGEDKLKTWNCTTGVCTAGNGKLYLQCSADKP